MQRLRNMIADLLAGPTTSGQVLLWLFRGAFGAISISVAFVAFSYFNDKPREDPTTGIFAFIGILFGCLTIVLIDIATRNKQMTTISAVYFGLLLGYLFGTLLTSAIEPFLTDQRDHRVAQFIRLLSTAVCCYIAVSTLLQTKEEFRFIIPYVEFQKQTKGEKPLVLDTSVIIDGRIADICETGIIDTKLVVPRFVLQELQAVADSSDKIKRNRGRRGLDMLKRLQTNTKIELVMHEANFAELREVNKVDERLVVLS